MCVCERERGGGGLFNHLGSMTFFRRLKIERKYSLLLLPLLPLFCLYNEYQFEQVDSGGMFFSVLSWIEYKVFEGGGDIQRRTHHVE